MERVIIIDLKQSQAESNFNVAKNRELQTEINSRKVNIDRGCFKKSDIEKEAVKVAKSQWKLTNLN